MRIPLPVCLLLAACLHAFAREEAVELVSGPDLTFRYDSTLWRPLAPVKPVTPDTAQSITLELQQPSRTQFTVASHPTAKDEQTFKRETLLAQGLRGDPADFIGERRQFVAGRNWLLLEFRNRNTRPVRRELHYFLPVANGYLRLFVVANEADLPGQQPEIEACLRGVGLR